MLRTLHSFDTDVAGSRPWLQALFEHALDAILLTDDGGRYVAANPAAEALTGYTRQELLGLSVGDLTLPDHQEHRGELWRDFVDNGTQRGEYVVRRKDGTPVHVSYRAVANIQPGLHLSFLEDLTEKRHAEDQLRKSQKMEAVGRLAGGVAHDFNNLVTAITGYSELLLDRLPADCPDRHELEEIRRAGERAAALTRQLLAFSRNQVMQPTVLDLGEVVQATQGMLDRLLGDDVRLLTALSLEPTWVRADRGQLEQVIVNLAVNARDAMPRGGELTLATSHVRLGDPLLLCGVAVEPGPYALLAVTDTGEGMAPEVVEQVFEPFFTTKEPGKGTGLGLSTAYGIVKQSGGYVFADSTPGEGTTFRVYLPRVEAERASEPPPRPVRVGDGRGETVLVVEDQDAVRGLIVQILERRGYRVLEAASGADAIELCRGRAGVDLVISDVVMPDMRGPELGATLTEMLPGTRLLFISGYPGASIVQRGELSEGTPFLQKPFTHDELTAKVRSLLDRSGA